MTINLVEVLNSFPLILFKKLRVDVCSVPKLRSQKVKSALKNNLVEGF